MLGLMRERCKVIAGREVNFLIRVSNGVGLRARK